MGDRKLYVRGATYGTFRSADGSDYPAPATVERDFAAMAAAGFNAIRTYTPPPCWLLDAAQDHALYVMVGLPWEQHVTFLEERALGASIEARVREGVRACSGHPAVLCYAVGNEIPAPIVRWHGRRRIERFIERLHRAAKDEDPQALVTYANYPSTEYLDLSFVDLLCFNVFLEEEGPLEAYVARLQNLAGDRPLVISELGLDSTSHGEQAQATSLASQVRTAFAGGCAGAFVFSWTDEWHRGEEDVEEWSFGLVDRDRRPKPALRAVTEAIADVPFPRDLRWPRVSVVLCTCDGAATLSDCLDGLAQLDYPDYEVIVVDDGSTDASAEIARRFPVQLICTENRGLSSARNTGLRLATGEIVAYIDDDARPDPHWLMYLAATFRDSAHPGAGGPNVPPPGGGVVAESVARAPGGPIHVLISDRQAEHVPGCNMAFRVEALRALEGFDERFRVAGDDVDICWRMQDAGGTLGFSPAAMVWHRRRTSIRGYLRQQFGYGKAEALLERKWPERYSRRGDLRWSGHIYGGARRGIMRPSRIYYGVWGSGLFQSRHHATPGTLSTLPLMPEWYLLLVALAAITGYDLLRGLPLGAVPFLSVPVSLLVLAAFAGALVFQATAAAAAATRGQTRKLLRVLAITALLFALQPLARLAGRVLHGLTPWRRHGLATLVGLPRPRTMTIWSEIWRPLDERLERLESSLRSLEVPVCRGGAFDRWDVEARGGWLGGARVRSTLEEHGSGRQLVRFRIWPRCSPGAVGVIGLPAALALGALVAGAGALAVVLTVLALVLGLRALRDCGAATAAVQMAVEVHLQAESLIAAIAHRPPPDLAASAQSLNGASASRRRPPPVRLVRAEPDRSEEGAS